MISTNWNYTELTVTKQTLRNQNRPITQHRNSTRVTIIYQITSNKNGTVYKEYHRPRNKKHETYKLNNLDKTERNIPITTKMTSILTEIGADTTPSSFYRNHRNKKEIYEETKEIQESLFYLKHNITSNRTDWKLQSKKDTKLE